MPVVDYLINLLNQEVEKQVSEGRGDEPMPKDWQDAYYALTLNPL